MSSKALDQCTGLEGKNSSCKRPEPDAILFELNKGANARYYRYAEQKINTERVRERQDYIKKCADDVSTCLGPRSMEQRLSNQPTYDGEGRMVSSITKVQMRSDEDFGAYHPEGQIREAMGIVDILRGQQHSRQCDLYGNMCGDESLQTPVRKPKMKTVVAGGFGAVKLM